MLEREIKFYNENISEWLKSQQGKFVLIKEEKVIGFFNSIEEAVSEGARLYGLSSFLVRQVLIKQDEIKVPALTLGVLYADPSHPILR
jgi:hypothetical protein